jgi:hypothetical protein
MERIIKFFFLGVTTVVFTGLPIFVHGKFQADAASVAFDASSMQYLIAEDSPSLSPSGPITIEFWVKLKSFPQIVNAVVGKWGELSGPAPFSETSYYLALEKIDGEQAINFAISNGMIGINAYVKWAPKLNTWYHVSVVYSVDGVAKFYINSKYAGSGSNLPTSINDSEAPLLIGQFGNAIASQAESGTNYWLDGAIDEVRIYNTARSQVQIRSDFRSKLKGNESGLVAYWNFNNNFNDLASGNTLTPVNGATFSSQVPNQLKDKSNNGKQK